MKKVLYGNESFKSDLDKLIKSGKLPQSVIIEGEAGIGKHVAASLLISAAVCEEENRPCLDCKQCHLALTRTHPDVKVYSPQKSTFKVETAREVRSAAYLKPLTSNCNVAVLEHCEKMNAEAQNALLKVLEEPPSSAMFILLTENAGTFLPTVISRCTLLRLSPVSHNEVLEWISANTDASPDEAYSAVTLADGNIGKAIELLGSEDTAEIKKTADEIYEGFVNKKSMTILKACCEAEKSSDPVSILKLLSDKLLQDVKSVQKYKTGKMSVAQFMGGYEASVKATDSLKASANKTLTFTLLSDELVRASKR